MPLRRWWIYVLKDPTSGEVRYVGKTENPRKRFINHRCGHSGRHCANWIKSLRARGLVPTFEIIDAGMGHGWPQAERAWIREYRERGARLTNIAEGGAGAPGFPCSQETKAKISAGNAGQRRSSEARARMSAAQKGHAVSPERRAKLAAANLGKKHSAATRALISELLRGRPCSAEARAKIGAANRGRQLPALRGKAKSPETRERMRIAQKERRARERSARAAQESPSP